MKLLNILRKPLLLAALVLAVLPIAARPRHMHRQAPAVARQFCPAAKALAHHRPSMAFRSHLPFGTKTSVAVVCRKAEKRQQQIVHLKYAHRRHYLRNRQRPH